MQVRERKVVSKGQRRGGEPQAPGEQLGCVWGIRGFAECAVKAVLPAGGHGEERLDTFLLCGMHGGVMEAGRRPVGPGTCPGAESPCADEVTLEAKGTEGTQSPGRLHGAGFVVRRVA